MNASDLRATALAHLTPNYGVRDIMLTRGEGARVWDADGNEYLDFLAGISVVNLGHCHPAVTAAIQQQATQLVHCSNLYLIPAQIKLAEKLCSLCFADRAFFANSGAEVNEAAIKLARLYSKKKHGDNRFEIITVRNSFHGRTLATIAATGQEKVQKGFEPLVQGFSYADLNHLESIRDRITDRTCAIMLEPVQGEGGIVAATTEFLKGLKVLCQEHKLLMIFDEIQCGMGRCGSWFAHQLSGVEPDIMTLAKALGNGFPIGAMLTRDDIAAVLEPGTHGSTFGGNPLACSTALAVLESMESENIPQRAAEMGEYCCTIFTDVLGDLPQIKEIRQYGLMLGIELNQPGASVVKTCAAAGLLINCTMECTLRLLPPLIVTKKQCDQAVQILHQAISKLPDNLEPAQPAAAGKKD